MAQRRMTSLDVIDTDAFLDMPQSSQLLYFHLNSRADDDGFVSSPKKIMRSIGSQKDDFSLLSAKKFIIVFDDGVCVIKHWRINNFIRKDIYKETKYIDLKNSLLVRKNGAYTLNKDDRAVKIPCGHFSLEDIESTLTERQPSIGKVREGKTNKENGCVLISPPKDTYKSKHKIAEQKGIKLKRTPRTSKQEDSVKVMKAISYYRDRAMEIHGMQFFKVKSDSRNKVIRKLATEANKNTDLNKLIDWWLDGAGEWAEYEPEQCFSTRMVERFINKTNKKAKKIFA